MSEEPAKFKPKRLPSISVDAPLERRWDVMGADEAKRLHARRQDEARRFSWFGPRAKKRAFRALVLTPVGFALVGWAFVGGNPRTWLTFLGFGVPLGLLWLVVRPLDYTAGLIYALCGVAATAVAGKTHLPLLASTGLLCLSIGIALGRVEESRRLDLED